MRGRPVQPTPQEAPRTQPTPTNDTDEAADDDQDLFTTVTLSCFQKFQEPCISSSHLLAS